MNFGNLPIRCERFVNICVFRIKKFALKYCFQFFKDKPTSGSLCYLSHVSLTLTYTSQSRLTRTFGSYREYVCKKTHKMCEYEFQLTTVKYTLVRCKILYHFLAFYNEFTHNSESTKKIIRYSQDCYDYYHIIKRKNGKCAKMYESVYTNTSYTMEIVRVYVGLNRTAITLYVTLYNYDIFSAPEHHFTKEKKI